MSSAAFGSAEGSQSRCLKAPPAAAEGCQREADGRERRSGQPRAPRIRKVNRPGMASRPQLEGLRTHDVTVRLRDAFSCWRRHGPDPWLTGCSRRSVGGRCQSVAMGRGRRTATGGLVLPLLCVAFAAAVAVGVPCADRVLAVGVDAYVGVWSWLGEQVGDSVADAARRAGTPPTPQPSS